jgi:hypothetical protein
VAALALLWSLAGGGAAQVPKDKDKDAAPDKDAATNRAPGAGQRRPAKVGPTGKGAAPTVVEMRFVDGGALKVTLRDERLEVRTDFGTLLIPAAAVERVEFGRRVPPAVAKKIAAAVFNLGSPDYKARQAAQAELASSGERAYPALLKAAESGDKEVARRAKEVLTKLREEVPEEELERPDYDVVHTANMTIVGRVTAETLKVSTLPFGEQSVRVADVRSLGGAAAAGPKNVLPDPGTLIQYQNDVGKSYFFRVTGEATGAGALVGGGRMLWAVGGAVFGTDVYTIDSALAAAAVHAGVLRPGETGVVEVTLTGPQASFAGSVRNGVSSNAYGPYPSSFKVSKVRR